MKLAKEQELPIGVFDSGIGGLTVLRALQNIMPEEHFLYLGDTARLPYGTKSAVTVRNYALNASDILVERGIKLLVVACNTATAVALEALQEKYAPLPVIGVILGGAVASLKVPGKGPIVVLATEGTVKWQAYRKVLETLAPHREIIEWPCSLMVSLAEEGWCQGELVEQILRKLFLPILSRVENLAPTCFLLGCTHFPVLKSAIQKVLGENMPVVDPAESVAESVYALLLAQDGLRTHRIPAYTQFMATDGIERFARVAQVFLERPIAAEEIELVTVPALTTEYQKVV